MRATISNEIVRLQAEYYGKGPTRAKTYIVEDLVVVVLEESFTRAEKTLAQHEREAIEHIRWRFQQQMADEFTSVVEQATGRKVRPPTTCLMPAGVMRHRAQDQQEGRGARDDKQEDQECRPEGDADEKHHRQRQDRENCHQHHQHCGLHDPPPSSTASADRRPSVAACHPWIRVAPLPPTTVVLHQPLRGRAEPPRQRLIAP
jgi:Na+-translocating membrane potential-generating system (MpsC)